MTELMIVDDHPIFLDGLRQFLTTHGQGNVRCAGSVAEALEMTAANPPDVLILDLSMKNGGGLHILSALRERGSDIPVIFLTVEIKPAETLEALRLRCNGIVLKESDPAVLLKCIETVMTGRTSVDPTVMEQALLHSVSAVQPKPDPERVLTDREREITALIRAGLRNRAIAEKIGLTEGTVKVHLHSVFQKLGVSSRAELIVSSIERENQVARD